MCFRIFLLLLIFSCNVSAEIFFKDTDAQTQLGDYSRSNVKGKQVQTVNVFPNQVYYIYISSSDGTIVNTSSPIQYIDNGARSYSPNRVKNLRSNKFCFKGNQSLKVENDTSYYNRRYTAVN